MVDATRALLDELMGKERDVLPNQRQNVGTHFSDPEVCKHFLCGFCPHQLFVNTKSDLGNCTKLHDDLLKAEYQNSPKKHQYAYERDFILYLERLIDDLDKKIRKGHDRLDPWAKDMKGLGGPLLSTENAEKVNTISDKINTLLQQIEELGEEGKVDECQQLMKTVDQLKAEKEQIIAASSSSISSQEKRMKVCEICGALLVVGDTEKRMASHLEGKQHIGYDLIRKTLEDFKKNHRSEYESFKRDRERPRDNRPRDYDRPRYDRRDRDRDRDRDYRDRDRDNRDRERDRSGYRRRDYDTYYDRDSDRDRKKPREDY